MQNLDRLKLELNNKEYFTEDEYTTFLTENGLDPLVEYNKSTNQRNLLWTVVDILEAVANDVDLMRKVETEFATTSDAVKHINDRIERIKNRIQTIPDAEEEYSNISLFFTRK
jgi:DNA polymerase II small subunit/DNA polymerase delta subunit B